jgi:hypothetical protein
VEWIAVFGKPAQVMVADGLGLALLVPYDHGPVFQLPQRRIGARVHKARSDVPGLT